MLNDLDCFEVSEAVRKFCRGDQDCSSATAPEPASDSGREKPFQRPTPLSGSRALHRERIGELWPRRRKRHLSLPREELSQYRRPSERSTGSFVDYFGRSFRFG